MAGSLEPLKEARNGRPTEPQAVRTIAIFAVIPAAVVGLLVGTQLVPMAASSDRLLAVCSASAFAAGGGALLSIFAIYRLFGFRPVVWLADALIGGLGGFFLGAFLSKVAGSFWPMLLCPLGVVLVPLLAPRPRRGPPE